MFGRQFQAKRQFQTVFWTSFSFLKQVANPKENGSCAKYFDAKHSAQLSFCLNLGTFVKKPKLVQKTVRNCPVAWNWRQHTLRNCRFFINLATFVKRLKLAERTVAHGVLDKFLLVNKRHQAQANRQFGRVFWRQFQATGLLRTVFKTSFSLLTKVAKFRQNDSFVEFFDANLKRQDSWARCFKQVIACYQNTSSSRTKFAQSVLTPVLMNWSVAHGVLKKF